MSSEPLALRSKPRDAVRFLFIGDIVGKPGVEALKQLLPGLLRFGEVDFCIANGENAEQGKGLIASVVREILNSGVDVITGGNHSLYRDKSHDIHASEPRLLRPHNYPPGTPGRGWGVFDAGPGRRVAVLNLQGRAMLNPSDDPFRLGRAAIESLHEETSLIIVDFHAEATAEKLAFARYVDGSVTAVIGTHTHVQTADDQILEGGTAYVTDVGMTGSHSGVIGLKTEHALQRFLYPVGNFKSGLSEGDARLSGVLVDANPATGRAVGVSRFQCEVDE